MSDQNKTTDGSAFAFPSHGSMGEVASHGMTYRQYLAAKVLQGFCANPAVFASNPQSGWALVNSDINGLAEYCYVIADAMLPVDEADRIAPPAPPAPARLPDHVCGITGVRVKGATCDRCEIERRNRVPAPEGKDADVPGLPAVKTRYFTVTGSASLNGSAFIRSKPDGSCVGVGFQGSEAELNEWWNTVEKVIGHTKSGPRAREISESEATALLTEARP